MWIDYIVEVEVIGVHLPGDAFWDDNDVVVTDGAVFLRRLPQAQEDAVVRDGSQERRAINGRGR